MNVRQAATFVCALAILAGCAPLPTRAISASYEVARAMPRRDVPPPATSGFGPAYATAARRSDTLERVWRTVEDDYFDRAFVAGPLAAIERRTRADLATVHSDADFYRVLKAGIGELPDSHSGVLTPRESEEERTEQAVQIGFAYRVVEGRVVVLDVVPGSPAEDAGLEAGLVVDAIDGYELDQPYLPTMASERAEAMLAMVSTLLTADGARERPHRLDLRRADDERRLVEVTARRVDAPTITTFSLLPSGVGVLRLSRFDPSAMAAVDRAIDRARVESRALIVDLRDNPGGDIDVFEDLMARFVARPTPIGTIAMRFWRIPLSFTLDADPGPRPYLMPLAVLIDGNTASAAEMTAHALVELRDAIPVGEATCGCVVGLTREFVLPDGGALFVAEAGFRSPHGRRMEGDPLQPVVTAATTLAEARAATDTTLRAAEQALLRSSDAASAK